MEEQFAGLLTKFEESGTKPWEVLYISTEDLARRVKISAREIESFREYYGREGVESPLTTIDNTAISTQMPEIDTLLGSGLHRGAITEVCGPAGAGKTCFCCQMALCTRSTIYIASEDNIVLVQRRMKQLAPRYKSMENVIFIQVKTLAELRIAAHQIRQFKSPPDLVILDSIAALVENGKSYIDQSELDDTIGLRRLCAETGCAVLVANQVRAHVGLENKATGPVYEFDRQEQIHGVSGMRPALGQEWAARIDSRLFIRRTGRLGRELLLVFSKWAPYGSVRMQMTELGLRVGESMPDPATSQFLSQPELSQ